MRAGVVDYRMGNLASVCKALDRVGATSFSSSDDSQLSDSDLLVLPGVGNFESGMKNLEQAGLADFIKDWITSGKSFIGICLGMQLLFESSEEGNTKGLGVIEGEVVRLSSQKKVPHMGWNTIEATKGFFKEYSERHFYFVHSYVCVPSGSLDVAYTSYGADFVSALATDRILAFQFHPEKSSSVGLKLLAAALKEIE